MFEEGIDPPPKYYRYVSSMLIKVKASNLTFLKISLKENICWKHQRNVSMIFWDGGGGCQEPKVALICAKFDWKLPERERERERDRDRDRDREIKVQNSIQFSATILSYHSNQC